MSATPARGEDGDLLVAGRRVQPALLRVLAPDGTRQQLEPKAMAVLLCLAQAAGQVVSRERLIQQVWQGGFVTDDVLTRAIGQLRKVFADDPERPAVIETIRTRGYRLLAPVAQAMETAAASPPPMAPSPASPPSLAAVPSAPSAAASPPALPPPIATAPSAPSPAASPPVAPLPRRRRRVEVGAFAAAFAILLGAAFLGHRATYPPGGTPRLVPVATGFAGEIRRPVLSPDGTRVAFTAQEQPGAGFSVQVVLLEGGNPLRLSSAPAGAFDMPAAWSPDGSALAYVRQGGGACEVRLVPALGGPDRRFGPCGDGEEPSVAWSPDGSFLVQSMRSAPGPRRLQREALDGGSAPRDLTRPPDGIWGDSEPAFSPDGQSIAFVRSLAPDVDDLWVVPAAGGTERRVTFDHAMVMGVDWLAGGQTLVFSSSRAGINSLWAVDAAGGTPRLLAGAGPKIKHPRAARTASRIVFESWELEINLRRVGAGGGSRLAAPVATGPDWSWSPRYSPDGSRAAFISTRSGSPEIWTAALPDGPAQRLTDFGGPQLASPSWSPDGERLVFVARPRGEANLYLVEARGGPPRRLTGLPGDEVEPSFSHDGRFVYFATRRSGGWQIERVQIAGGAIEPVTRDGGYTAQESADGSGLLFTRPERPGLFRLSLPLRSDSPVRQLAPDLRPAQAQAWEAGPAGIFLDLPAGDEHRVVGLGPSGSRSLVAPLPELAWNGFSVRGDGAEVLYAHLDRHACRFVLLDRPRVD